MLPPMERTKPLEGTSRVSDAVIHFLFLTRPFRLSRFCSTPVSPSLFPGLHSIFHKMYQGGLPATLPGDKLQPVLKVGGGHQIHLVPVFCGCIWWLGGRVVSVLDSGAESPGSNRSRDAVLGKLFTSIVPLFTKQQNWYQPS